MNLAIKLPDDTVARLDDLLEGLKEDSGLARNAVHNASTAIRRTEENIHTLSNQYTGVVVALADQHRDAMASIEQAMAAVKFAANVVSAVVVGALIGLLLRQQMARRKAA